MLVSCLYILGHPKIVIPFHSKRRLLWPLIVASDSKMCLGLDVKWQIITKFGFSQQFFIKVTNIKFHGNPSFGSCINNMQTEA